MCTTALESVEAPEEALKTCKFVSGADVPIPTLPLESIRIRSALVVLKPI